jgi:hypothetical protein
MTTNDDLRQLVTEYRTLSSQMATLKNKLSKVRQQIALHCPHQPGTIVEDRDIRGAFRFRVTVVWFDDAYGGHLHWHMRGKRVRKDGTTGYRIDSKSFRLPEEVQS